MELYWLLRLPHLHAIFYDIAALSLVALIVLSLAHILSFSRSPKDSYQIDLTFWIPFRDKFWLAFYLFTFSALIAAFIPTKIDLALMMGWDALKSDSVQEVIEILKDKIKD